MITADQGIFFVGILYQAKKYEGAITLSHSFISPIYYTKPRSTSDNIQKLLSKDNDRNPAIRALRHTANAAALL